MAFVSDLNKLKLLSREEILRRLARMKGAPNVRRRHEITRLDMARWMGVDVRYIRFHETLREPITDSFQIIYSQFFHLIESGQLVIDPNQGPKKVLIRVPPPAEPPRKPIRPHIALSSNGPKLRFDHS